MNIYKITPTLDFIDASPPIYGFTRFFGVYVLRGKKLSLIDVGPASSSPRLFEGLSAAGIAPEEVSYIFATHIHIDHVGGLGAAMKRLPNAVAVMHEKGKPHIVAPEKLWEGSKEVLGELAINYGPFVPVPADRIISVSGETKFDLGGIELTVLPAPGHASHHLCFYNAAERRLFVGDSAGVYTPEVEMLRPDTASPFHLEHFLNTLDRLTGLSPETLCFTHFGCRGDAVNRLREHKKRMILWGKVIAENLSEKDWQVIWEKIRLKDKLMERMDMLPPDIRHREMNFTKTSIAGYVNYFNKYGTAVLEKNK